MRARAPASKASARRARVLELVDHEARRSARELARRSGCTGQDAAELQHQLVLVEDPGVAHDAVVAGEQLAELDLAQRDLALRRAGRPPSAAPPGRAARPGPIALQPSARRSAQEPGEQAGRIAADLVAAQRQLVEAVEQQGEPVGRARPARRTGRARPRAAWSRRIRSATVLRSRPRAPRRASSSRRRRSGGASARWRALGSSSRMRSAGTPSVDERGEAGGPAPRRPCRPAPVTSSAPLAVRGDLACASSVESALSIRSTVAVATRRTRHLQLPDARGRLARAMLPRGSRRRRRSSPPR